jgi:hypothetical protein
MSLTSPSETEGAAASTGVERRRRLVHRLYRAVLPHFRRQRMRLLERALSLHQRSWVLDVGGTPYNWQHARVGPRVTILNLDGGDVIGDGRRLPFRDRSFDVVFSNSTIEHVGDERDQSTFATEITRVGDRYFVQTPNRWFPIEPHLLTPLVHFLPMAARTRVARNFTLRGWLERPSPEDAAARVASVRLLGPRDMRRLFPDAHLHKERWLGVCKSLVAIRR